MNVRRAANGARTRMDARSHSLALLTVGALLLPTLFLLLGATDTEAAPMAWFAETLYGVVPDGVNSRLVTVDPTDGSVITDVGLITDASLVAFAGVTGLAFADHDILFAVSSDSVLKIDLRDEVQVFPNFVLATPLSTSFSSPVHDLDFDDGVPRVLFGIQDTGDGSTTTLRTFNLGTGLASSVGGTTVTGRSGSGNGLAFAVDDMLYNASGDISLFFGFPSPGAHIDWLKLDVVSGIGMFNDLVTFDGASGNPEGRISSMALAPDGTLYGSLNVTENAGFFPPADDFLVTIDTSGVVTKVGAPAPTPTTKGLDGLAFRPPPVGGGGPVAFASFEVTKLDLKKKNGDFHIHAKFRLGAGNNGVDILGEPFTFQVINPDNDEILFELNLPDAGGVSFSEKRTNKFQYKVHNKSTKEKVDIKIDIKKNGEYKFHAKGKHVVMNLGDPEKKALVRVKLTIGDDFRDISDVRAKIKK